MSPALLWTFKDNKRYFFNKLYSTSEKMYGNTFIQSEGIYIYLVLYVYDMKT